MHRKNDAIVSWLAGIAHYVIRLAVFGIVTAMLAMVAMLATSQPSQAATVAGAPSQEYAACQAAYHFHHVNATEYADSALWHAAYRAARNAARSADPGLRHDIDRYLFTDQGWSLVAYDCNPDA